MIAAPAGLVPFFAFGVSRVIARAVGVTGEIAQLSRLVIRTNRRMSD